MKNPVKNILRTPLIPAFILLLIALFCRGTTACSQTIAQDSIRARHMIQNILDSPTMEPQRLLAIGAEIVRFSTEDNYPEGIVRGLIAMASADGQQLGNTMKAVESYTRAIAISRQNKFYRHEGLASLGISQMYGRLGLADKEYEWARNALSVFRKINDSVHIAMSYKLTGYGLLDMHQYKSAIDQYLLALAIDEQTGNFVETEAVNNMIGAAYVEIKDYTRAFRYLHESIRIARAIDDSISDPYLNIAACYQYTGQYDSAYLYFQKSLHVAGLLEDKNAIGSVYVNLGNLFLKQNKLREAELFSNKGLQILKEVLDKPGLVSAYTTLASIDCAKHDFKSAYAHQLLAYAANDSLMNDQKQKAMAEMQVRFDVKDLDSKNKLLQQENNIKQVKLQRRSIVAYAGFGAAILCLIIGFLLVRQNKLKTNQQKLELEQKQLLAQINPHFIFNCLNSIQQFVIQKDTLNANRYLADFALLMRQTLDNSKDGMISLHREIEYLENYLLFEHMRFEDKFTYVIDCAPDVNKDTTEIPSMIIQPFVENAIRHGLCNLESRQGQLKISFYKKESFLFCEVDDNGIGMDEALKLKEQTVIKYQSHGMELTRQRLALVSKMHSEDYKVTIINKMRLNKDAQGTTIIIKFPLQA